jgi:O-acetyl-ADP-ribose deacetylase (regulator of RNase III)
MAFSELYTRAQSVVRTLGVCGVNGKVMTSNELVELLYMAYNRDEAEVYGLDKALKAGYDELTKYCSTIKTPLNDGDAVITPSFNIDNAEYIIHTVGPNFSITPDAFDALLIAYYNSLIVLRDNELHSISFPLISAGIYGGKLPNPVSTSTENCIKAYNKFKEENPNYEIDVRLCAFTEKEYLSALEVYNNLYEEEHKLKK